MAPDTIFHRLGRPLAIWGGSLIAVGALLMPYVPGLWGPLLAAGAVTFAITVIRVLRQGPKSS